MGTVATFSSPAARRAADRLRTATRTRTPCPPVRDLLGTEDIGSAYAVQELLIAERLVETGSHMVGRKIGLTSPAVQQQLGVDQPDFGVLLDDMAYRDGDLIDTNLLLQPKVEAEVAFVLGEDLIDGDLTLGRVRAAVDYAVAALEVVDSRIADWDITYVDTVADNASSGLYVLGTERRTLDAFEPHGCEMHMSIDEQVVSTGNGRACLGDPLNALKWLAATARDFGEPLVAGQVILSGALGPMAVITSPCTVRAEISGLGTVTATFTKEHTS